MGAIHTVFKDYNVRFSNLVSKTYHTYMALWDYYLKNRLLKSVSLDNLKALIENPFLVFITGIFYVLKI